MQITLSDTERELMLKVVEQYYSTLREEIYKSEAHGIKGELKAEEVEIKSILQRLQHPENS